MGWLNMTEIGWVSATSVWLKNGSEATTSGACTVNCQV